MWFSLQNVIHSLEVNLVSRSLTKSSSIPQSRYTSVKKIFCKLSPSISLRTGISFLSPECLHTITQRESKLFSPYLVSNAVVHGSRDRKSIDICVNSLLGTGSGLANP